ncbi:hypothetical protein DASC09_009340 [Saccharomycopsis crataegensis]|uniref:Uncharacterized protein n=1 Tax=Saccharomycopsis crataegensis TaxID=43959 RepID=A0AAV5QFU7_9ASCO|nr:hypothetical protein DASC09_009340 [Saccharomycopsis crataegensis]
MSVNEHQQVGSNPMSNSGSNDSRNSSTNTIRLPPISFISGLQRPNMNGNNLPKLEPNDNPQTPQQDSIPMSPHIPPPSASSSTSATHQDSPRRFDIQRTSTSSNSPNVTSKPTLPSFDHTASSIDHSPRPVLPPTSLGDKQGPLPLSSGGSGSGVSKPGYQLPGISSFDNGNRGNNNINSILNNNTNETSATNGIYQPAYGSPSTGKPFSSGSNINSLLNNNADNEDNNDKNGSTTSTHQNNLPTPATFSSPHTPVVSTTGSSAGSHELQPSSSSSLQTRMIIHQHHPTRFNPSKDEPSSANTSTDVSYNSPGMYEKDTNVLSSSKTVAAAAPDSNVQVDGQEPTTVVSTAIGPVNEETNSVCASPRKETPKPFIKPKVVVSNEEALGFAGKFPRKRLGSMVYSLSPTLSLQAMLDNDTREDKELEEVYKKEIEKNHTFVIPELRDHINSIITVRIPKFYLQHKNNPNLSVKRRSVWGTDIYTDDSDIVAILKHCGFISDLEDFDDSEEQQVMQDLKELVGEQNRVVITPGFKSDKPNVLYANSLLNDDGDNETGKAKDKDDTGTAANVDNDTEKTANGKQNEDNNDDVKPDEDQDKTQNEEDLDKTQNEEDQDKTQNEEDQDKTQHEEDQDKTQHEDTTIGEENDDEKKPKPKEEGGEEEQKQEVEAEEEEKKHDEFGIEQFKNQSNITVELLVLPTLKHYQGSFRNNLNSRSWRSSHDGVSVALYSVKYDNFQVNEDGPALENKSAFTYVSADNNNIQYLNQSFYENVKRKVSGFDLPEPKKVKV